MSESQVEYASVIRSSGVDLLNLLNGILDLAKVESGTINVDVTDLDLERLSTALQREFELVAQGKGLEYSVVLAPGSPATIATDPQRLRQVLTNLLANALKFTEHGHVRIEIGLAAEGWNPRVKSLVDAPAVLAIRVEDTGIGIPAEQHERIFEAFAQGDGTTARIYGGTGLGLSISRELVGLLGGELTVTSASGVGSTFTLFLPTAAVERIPEPQNMPDAVTPRPLALTPERTTPRTVIVPAVPSREVPEDHDFDGANVLVVDDDFRNIFAMTALLERGHANVLVAESGHDALAVLEREPNIDIVLMDIMMPIMDGYATIQAIRAIDRFDALPIVAVTGKVVPGERQRCLDAGANDFIPKPVDTSELLAVLRPWLLASLRAPA